MIAYHLSIKNGDLFDGKYHVIGQIGNGSYGDVYKVLDHKGEVYALKVLRLWEIMGDLHEGLIRRFEQEYKVMRISSEYLVHSLDFGTVQGNPFILMEYCPKGDLSKFISQDSSKIALYACDILQGLYALHREGKVHRDLKPENVLLRQNGKAALTDFGVVGEMEKAKRMSEVGWWKNKPKQTFGTPLYMSPEIYYKNGGGITYLPTVDIWSFGVMMYEVLTHGSFPFGNIDSVEDFPQYMEHAKQGRWNREALNHVSQGDFWLPVITRCLAPNQKERYQSTLDILQDLNPLIGSVEPILATERQSRKLSISSLVISQGENLGKRYDLRMLLNGRRRMLHVGREKDNDIVLPAVNNSYVSRYHFTLEKSADGLSWLIRDGQWQKSERCWVTSTNGTYLNATPVSSQGIKVFTGDIITVGEYKLKVE